MSGFGRLVAAGAMVFAGAAAQAQESSTNRVDAMTDWSVFEGESPKECWAVTTFKESVNTDAAGNIKAVQRGEILLMVFFRPGEDVTGQVAFTGGYPFAPGSTVNANVSGTEFELFTEGEWAWPATPQDDARLVTAMKRGADAVLTARSSRGTITKDTFSLLGFTAAVEDAAKRCGG
ncbi:invasion associated locus B family protein [Thalassococcus arenae]